MHPALYNLTYDLRKTFEPVAMLLSSPNTLAVHPSLPANTLSEFIALAKSKPGDIQYASAGVGGSLHLGMELFRMQAGLEMLHVPFRGAGPAAIDVVAGNTKAVMSSTSTLSPHVRSGKLRGIGISSRARLPSVPEVPTFIEAGFPQYEAGNWIGFAVPAGTPKSVVEKLQKEIAAILDLPDVQKQFENRGATAEKMTAAEFGAYIDAELANGAGWSGTPRSRPSDNWTLGVLPARTCGMLCVEHWLQRRNLRANARNGANEGERAMTTRTCSRLLMAACLGPR